MRNILISMFPSHKIYVEGFGGAAHILFEKSPSEIDVYNDINEGLYLFFKLLRNEETSDKLISLIQLTPYSRQEFYYCRDNYNAEINELEKARMFYIKTMQSFSSIGTAWSYSKNKSRRGMSQAISKFLGNVDDNIIDIIERLRSIQVENLDIIDLINKYDSEDTFFYLDPPYISDTRVSSSVYDNEMPKEKHIELINRLIDIKGKVLLSGYDNEIYNILTDNNWDKIDIGIFKNRNRDSDGEKSVTKSEWIWKNYQ